MANAPISMPTTVFSAQEWELLKKVCSIYTPSDALAAALNGLNSKLTCIDDAAKTGRRVIRLEDTPRSILTTSGEVIAMSLKDSPVLKFIKCPTTLILSQLGIQSRLNLRWDESNSTVAIRTTSMVSYGEIRLSPGEQEVVTAFMNYFLHRNGFGGETVEYVTDGEPARPQEEV